MKGRNEMDRSEIWQLLSADAGSRCSVSTARDFDTVARRTKHEGASFFNVTLPAFGKDFERSLEEGCIPTPLFRGFVRKDAQVKVTPPDGNVYTVTLRSGGVPMFLQGFMDIVFDTNWEVTEEEWFRCGEAVRNSDLVDHNFFPPILRTPKGPAEEERMADAIHCVRQLTLLFSKEWALPSEELIQRASEAYVTVDKELELPFWISELTDS